jgi:hypothetical protein
MSTNSASRQFGSERDQDIRRELERRPPHRRPYDIEQIIRYHVALTRRIRALLSADPP